MHSIILICNKCDHKFWLELVQGFMEKSLSKTIICPNCGGQIEITLSKKFEDGSTMMIIYGARRGLSLEIGGI